MRSTSATTWRGALLVPTHVSQTLSRSGASRGGISKETRGLRQGSLRPVCQSIACRTVESSAYADCRSEAPWVLKRTPQSMTPSGFAWRLTVRSVTVLRGPPWGGARSVGSRLRSMSTMSEAEFHVVAEEELEGIQDTVEAALEEGFEDEFDCNLSQGVLNIIVGDRGTWVLNKQAPNRQIWWSSPASGPMRFEYDANGERWLNTRDGTTELRSLLASEMKEECGVDLDEPYGS